MALDALSSGMELVTTLLNLVAPSLTQEQKESLLDAYKNRTAEIQAASDAIKNDPESREAQLAYGALSNRLCNAAGFPASGLASIDVAVPLDDLDTYLAAINALILVLEQNAVKG